MTFKKTVAWAAVALWMGLIFYLSSQPAVDSNQLSRGITEVMVRAIEKIAPDTLFETGGLNNFLRKSAHFFAFFVLGVVVVNALSIQGSRSREVNMRLAFFICVLFAVSDEVHQLYVPGRGGQVSDVLLDSAGALTGIGLWRLMVKGRRNRTESG